MFQIKKLAGDNKAATVLVDAGNVLFKQPTITYQQELLTASGLIDLYQDMAYDAVAVGAVDLAGGLTFLQQRSGKNFPWLSANLLDKHNAPLFTPSKIIERAGVKIGIIGLTGDISGVSQEMLVGDWQKALASQLEKLAPTCNLLIVLSNLPPADNLELTKKYPQVQILVTASSQQGKAPPQKVNKTLMAESLPQGKNLGYILCGVQGDGQHSQVKLQNEPFNQPVLLKKELPEDPVIAEKVDVFKKAITKNNLELIEKGKNTPAQPPLSKLAGFVRCEECHPVQTQFWKKTNHAKAYNTLQQKHQNLNLDCLPCHVTLEKRDSGQKVSSAEEMLRVPPELQTVTCESCHESRLQHAASPDTRKSSLSMNEAVCHKCHTPDHDPFFRFTEKLAKIKCPQS